MATIDEHCRHCNRIATASVNIADIAKFLVPFIYNVNANDFTVVLSPVQKFYIDNFIATVALPSLI